MFKNNLKIFVFTLAILIVVGMFFPDSVIVVAEKDTPDTVQIYYSENDVYSEKDSSLGAYSVGKSEVEIFLPVFDRRVRIDPATTAGEVLISKIIVRRLFISDTYTGNRLQSHSKPLMMISGMRTTPSGLLILSTGNDPAFEFEPDAVAIVPFFQMLGLGLLIFLFCKIGNHLKQSYQARHSAFKANNFAQVAVPLLVSTMIIGIFYPGFMSYDTLHAIRAARNGVIESVWPPMVSYVWRIVDFVSPNPSAMHFSQVFILTLSFFYIVNEISKNCKLAITSLLTYVLIPVILGSLAVIWKDVLVASSFFAGFALALALKDEKGNLRIILLNCLAISFIFIGICSRHNAITGALPIIYYLIFVNLDKFIINKKLILGLSFLISFLLSGLLYHGKTRLDIYIIPSFTKMESSTNDFIIGSRVRDIAAASLCANQNLFGVYAPNITVSEIAASYNPKHTNLSLELYNKVGVTNGINKIWFEVLIDHPICIFYNKFLLAKYLLGINHGDQFIITHPAIDDNEYGYFLHASPLRDKAISYILSASQMLIFRPWFFHLLNLVFLIFLLFKKRLSVEYACLYLSGAFYMAGIILFGNAADARLIFYSNSISVLLLFLSIGMLRGGKLN